MDIYDKDDRRGLWKAINQFVTGPELHGKHLQSAARKSARPAEAIYRRHGGGRTIRLPRLRYRHGTREPTLECHFPQIEPEAARYEST